MQRKGADRLAAKIRRIVQHPSSNFVQLVRVAGLDPASAFRSADLSGVNFSGCRLDGYDFSGANLEGAVFRNARIAGAKFDGRQRLLPELLAAADYASSLGGGRNPYRGLKKRELAEILSHAASEADIPTIRDVLAAGLPINHDAAQDGISTALIALSSKPPWRKIVGTAQFLLRAGADVNQATKRRGVTPLMAAVSNGDVPLTRLFLDHGADVTSRDLEGWTALHRAGLYGNRYMIKLLMDAGADSSELTDGKIAEELQVRNEIVDLFTPPKSDKPL